MAFCARSLSWGSRIAHAETAEQLIVDASEGAVALSRYAAVQPGRRAAVIVLHGARGFELRPRAYQRYADALTASGIDAYLIRYYSAADDQTLARTAMGEAHQTLRYEAWADRVSSAIAAILARPDSSGRLGLLGFSRGGYVAATAAALAVLYGGMPDRIAPGVKHLPPLLELHGEADHNVPIARGEELVRLAKAVGAPAEMVRYPGKEHGFDFADNDPVTADAIGRVMKFFQSRLNTIG